MMEKINVFGKRDLGCLCGSNRHANSYKHTMLITTYHIEYIIGLE